jgi:hypothetical protein
MEAIYSSETLIPPYQTSRCHIQEVYTMSWSPFFIDSSDFSPLFFHSLLRHVSFMLFFSRFTFPIFITPFAAAADPRTEYHWRLFLSAILIEVCAIANAVSRRVPTAAVRVRSQVRLYGICDGQSGAGAGFLQVFRFPLPILIPPTAPHSSCIIRGWYSGPISCRRTKWTQCPPPPQETKE